MADHPNSPADPALDTLEAIAAYLASAFESGDADRLTRARASVAQSGGLAELAAATGLPRAQLADALNAGEMSLDTTLTLMKVIDLHQPGEGPASVN
jgi:probable addiction module antidote protein